MSLNRKSIFSCCYGAEQQQLEPGPVIAHKGITNLGSTGYMPWTIHLLYYISPIRKAMYQLNTSPETVIDEEDYNYWDNSSPTNIMLALQKIFCDLQFGKNPASVKSLVKCLRCHVDKAEDAVDFMNFIITTLSDPDKRINKDVSNAISDCLFLKLESYQKCELVDYDYRRKEPADSLMLEIDRFSSLNESLDNFFERSYSTRQIPDFGKIEEVQSGYLVSELPVIALLNLKRYGYSQDRQKFEKISKKFEYPANLDLSKYCIRDMKSPSTKYQLFGVLIHSGTATDAGHYYHCMDPKADGNWHIFDDDLVMKCTRQEAIEDNFSGIAVAYALAYLRQDHAGAEITCDVKMDDIPKHVLKYKQRRK